MIDCHVHLRDWEQSYKESISHGVALAAKAGFKAFFDMPNTVPALCNAETLKKRIRYGQAELAKIGKDLFYGVYAGLCPDPAQIKEVVDFATKNFPNCVGLKMFAGNSTGNMGIVSEDAQKSVYNELTRLKYKGVLAVHCEKESYIKNSVFIPEQPETHSLARPPLAEIYSIADQIKFMKESGFEGHLHICHISTAEGIKLVQDAKKDGINISSGATAHHALLNIESYKKYGIRAKMNPPLREESDREAVFSALLSGEIDTIESDHAPHSLADKKKGASGVPGFAGSLLLMKALRKASASEELLYKLCGGNVNSIFGTNFPIRLASDEVIERVVPIIVAAYEYTIF